MQKKKKKKKKKNNSINTSNTQQKNKAWASCCPTGSGSDIRCSGYIILLHSWHSLSSPNSQMQDKGT